MISGGDSPDPPTDRNQASRCVGRGPKAARAGSFFRCRQDGVRRRHARPGPWTLRQTGQGPAAIGLRPPGARRKRLSRSLHPLRPVRPRLPLRHPFWLARPETPVATGTPPYFTARTGPCEMCEDIPCVKACRPVPRPRPDRHQQGPHGSRRPHRPRDLPQLPRAALRCLLPRRPVIDKAITLELLPTPAPAATPFFCRPVHSDHCTGCGKCEKSCVLEAAIKVTHPSWPGQARRTTIAWVGKNRKTQGHSLLDRKTSSICRIAYRGRHPVPGHHDPGHGAAGSGAPACRAAWPALCPALPQPGRRTMKPVGADAVGEKAGWPPTNGCCCAARRNWASSACFSSAPDRNLGRQGAI